ncbi:duf803 domain protein membrane protein [Grosmannia clavigera kw1407]|uniref:Duf803 domain protein membrane protein n=1 Tax=Grosmannia clavigera (strain kw1407 / UAMH 11150) TaxID=655863 RepID=F0X8P9_GROCL|nr:duf803 domain protein membrane protein [Grosmannia clavigera kw1407]EFX05289.1 duf803 domain protein membrane protein [Grosmannia clavigera kw1407]
MDHMALALDVAHEIYARNGTSTTSAAGTTERPAVYKVIGICLAVGSGAFIGTSYVLKKFGLLKANEKYNEVAGEGYGYLKNGYWWTGMTLMIIGEICNFAAYAFTDAILVTPLGALSVVITTILSAFFLKERLSMVGKVACFLCIVGSVVIVMNAPEESSVSTIQEMQHYVIAPGFLSYAGVIIVGSVATAIWAGPRWGKKNMLVYISICSWIGGLSVVATQGLGAAIVAQANGTPQFNQWFIYVLLVFVITTLVTEIVFLNKALNLFNAALVTPTYYVYFTTTTIVTSAVLFRGFKGSVTSIVTVVMGFLIICSGVVLLQLSKSAKDIPDSAVFAGDLDQIQTIAEQEQSETEPKADAIRGTAALVRQISSARQKMEMAELKRMHEESMQGHLEVVSENGAPEEYEWDGIRRRRTTRNSLRSRTPGTSGTFTPPPRTPHPPLGWSHIPSDDELLALDRPNTPSVLSSIAGTIRGRHRSTLIPQHLRPDDAVPNKVQSPMHPLQLTSIAVPAHHRDDDEDVGTYYGGSRSYGHSAVKTEYLGAGSYAMDYAASDAGSLAPEPPPHSAKRQFSFQNVFRRTQHHSDSSHVDASVADHSADVSHLHRPVSSRGYSAPQVKGASEEERLGLVKNDSRVAAVAPQLPPFEEEEVYDEDEELYADNQHARYGRGITGSSPPRHGGSGSGSGSGSGPYAKHESGHRSHRSHHSIGSVESIDSTDYNVYDVRQGRGGHERQQSRSAYRTSRPPPPSSKRYSPPRGGDNAFV